MKKVALILLAVATLAACKPSKKENEKKAEVPTYQLDAETAIVNWIGYKFTSKKGVNGQMQTVNISNNQAAESIEEALDGVEFSIPVSSIFSNDDSRDTKLKTLFFGVMDNTEVLSGTVTETSKDGGVISLTMNNETHDLPFTLDTQGKTAYLKATLDLNRWHAQKALESLHKACELLHTGEDGISKTWDTVDLDAVLNF